MCYSKHTCGGQNLAGMNQVSVMFRGGWVGGWGWGAMCQKQTHCLGEQHFARVARFPLRPSAGRAGRERSEERLRRQRNSQWPLPLAYTEGPAY